MARRDWCVCMCVCVCVDGTAHMCWYAHYSDAHDPRHLHPYTRTPSKEGGECLEGGCGMSDGEGGC